MKRTVPINKPAGAETSCESDKHISSSIRVFEWAFVVTVVAFVAFGSYTWHSYTEFQNAEDEYDEVVKIEGRITYLDEVLTMSARMAAATGDLGWEERYKSFAPKLDAAIKRAIALVPQTSIAESAVQTDAANTRLVAMEKKAFDLVRQDRGKDALALLQSEEYEEQKLLYSRGVRHYVVALRQYIKDRSHEFRKLALIETAFVGVLIFAATFSGSCVLQMSKRVTVRERTERVIRMAYEELETSSNELKQMQSQLVQNEKLASIGQLAAGVAHEMNTPIGFVASNFQTLENYLGKIRELFDMYGELTEEIEAAERNDLLEKAGVIKEKYKEMKIDFILRDIEGLFDDSREGLERVESIVQNLRDFSRIDQPGSTDEYDFNRGVEATLVVARNEIKYEADVKTELSDVPATRCHAGQINQVLLNILLNAAQAIESQERQDRGTITIRTYGTEEEVVCEISDDGPGISTENLSRIFDPFFTTKPVGKGTGLGLSVSYDIIVHKNNGKLLVDSTVGKGTKFTIRLPIRNEEISGEIEVESNGQENSVICG